MSVFKVMQGTFGTDGLESKWKVFHADTAEACWKHIYDTVRDISGPYAKHARLEMLTSWVEEHTDLDDDYSAVRVTEPYPSVKTFDPPEYIRSLMSHPEAYFDGAESLRQRDAESGNTVGREFVRLISELPRATINELLR